MNRKEIPLPDILEGFKLIKEADCIHNGYRALQIARRNDPKEENLPKRLLFVRSKKHAYLQIGREVFNEGVTWPSQAYPNFTLEELEKMLENEEAIDLTGILDSAYSQTPEGGTFQIEGQTFYLRRSIIDQ